MPSKVSVIIPAYNAEKTLADTLDSVLQSTYGPLEIIVVNDGSTDRTLEIAEDYAVRDERLRVVNQANGGVCKARNHAITLATGDYIFPLDADDKILPGLIKTAASILDKDAEVKVVVPRAEFFGNRQGEWKLVDYTPRLLARKNMIPASSMYRRVDWERAGGYCEEIIAREDWDFWISVLKDGGKVVRTSEILLQYRISDQSKRVRDRKLFRHVVETLNRRHPEFFERELGGVLRYQRTWSRLINKVCRFFNPRHCVVNPAFADKEYFVRALRQHFLAQNGERIFMNRNEIREFRTDKYSIVVKSFRVPNLLNRVAYGFLRKSKAERSYNYARMLLHAGIGSPEPVGWVSYRKGLLFTHSYYASLRSSCPIGYMEVLDLPIPQRDSCLRAIAATTARMHEQGWLHTDYSRGNILCGFNADGTVNVDIIDLNRIRFRRVDCLTGCKNFERLPGKPDALCVMADEYARLRGFDARECRKIILQTREKERS